MAVSSSIVIRDGEVTRRVGGNDVNEIENNFARDEISPLLENRGECTNPYLH